MSKSKSKSKSKSDDQEGGAVVSCVHFKKQRAEKKRQGCVQSAPCAQCPGCAYLAPKD